MNYKNLLKSKKYKIGIWGTGYIGLSTMVYFSKKNIKCVGFDINKEKVRKINFPIKGTWSYKNRRKSYHVCCTKISHHQINQYHHNLSLLKKNY